MPEDNECGGGPAEGGSERVSLGRRGFVAATGTALAASVAGLTGSAVGSSASADFAVDTKLDAVQDLGMDPNGGSQIDAKLQDAAADRTLIVFPDGQYKLGSVSFSGLNNFAMVAADGANPTFVATSSWSDWVNFSNCGNIQLEGLDFDMRDGNNGGTINMQMDGSWILRDVRKLGQHPDRTAGFRLAANNGNATGLAERVEARDGAADGVGAVGIFVPPAHAGELIVRDSVIAHFTNNGLYGSAPGHGDGGSVKVEGGLFKNNHVAGVRLGSQDSYARQVTVVNDAVAPTIGSDPPNQRGFYIRQGGDNIVIDDCDVVQEYEGSGQGFTIGGAATGNGCQVTNCRIKNNSGSPAIYLNSDVADGWSGSGNHLTGTGNLSAPSGWVACQNDGCDEPTKQPIGSDSSSDSTTSTDLPNTLVVDDTESSTKGTTYSFTVSEQVQRSGELGSLDGADSVSGSTATGAVWGGVDGYRFSGEITDLTFDGQATLLVNGEVVDPATYGATTDLPNTLVVDASQTGGEAHYEFTVSDTVVRSGELGSLDGADSVSGSTATGAVWGGVDGYRFSGEITDFAFEGDADVYLNGELVAPSTVGRTQLPNQLVIDAKSTSSQASYAIEVSGELQPGTEFPPESADQVSTSAVQGTVDNEIDAFRYSGDIVAFDITGSARIDVSDNDD